MTTREDYFNWLLSLIQGRVHSKIKNYRELLLCLHQTQFCYYLEDDKNRWSDGISLRWRYICETGNRDISNQIKQRLAGPCSVLEMMIALAVRCEETIMDDPSVGNRTGQWFWGMVTNLGLGDMTNDRFDEDFVEHVIDIFINREYEPDGEGGLFTIRNCDDDLRDVSIWMQLCWYLDTIY